MFSISKILKLEVVKVSKFYSSSFVIDRPIKLIKCIRRYNASYLLVFIKRIVSIINLFGIIIILHNKNKGR